MLGRQISLLTKSIQAQRDLRNGDTKPINTAQNSAKTQQLEVSRKLLESVSFKRIIDRGYTVIWDENSRPITSASSATIGQQVTVEFADGKKHAKNATKETSA